MRVRFANRSGSSRKSVLLSPPVRVPREGKNRERACSTRLQRYARLREQAQYCGQVVIRSRRRGRPPVLVSSQGKGAGAGLRPSSLLQRITELEELSPNLCFQALQLVARQVIGKLQHIVSRKLGQPFAQLRD